MNASFLHKWLRSYRMALGRYRRRVGLLARYLQRLGPTDGWKAFRLDRLNWGAKPGEQIILPCGRGQAISLRAATTDVDIFEQIFIDEDCAVSPHVAEPRLILDCGAHIGCAARSFAQQFPNAAIIAVEAEARNFEQLKKNVAQFPRIKPLHAAVWKSRGFVRLASPDDESWTFKVTPLRDASDKAAHIPSLAIDDLLAMTNEPRIGLLKLDVEGAEREIFSADCDGWLSLVDAIIIELHDRFAPGCRDAFMGAIVRHPDLRQRHASLHNLVFARTATQSG